ncbi:MAG: DEAD/DEAH box helicase [Boseongicola sp. SB0677_bin_26]|nr:DEAD/DEAH box helicase [Boseongicola sp. SB0665_bin_10]MYG24739.1 DEAD/DEAH box helicase [Boseongicola sp. SB0677_bin_26]
MSKPAKRARKGRRASGPKRPEFLGWNTTDEEEIERRRWRGITEVAEFEELEPEFRAFGSFRVQSSTGSAYVVEIRHLERQVNSCTCRDFEVAGLGTCKHVEGVLNLIANSGSRMRPGSAGGQSPRFEVHLQSMSDAAPAMLLPDGDFPADVREEVERRLKTFQRLQDDRSLASLRQVADEHPHHVRVSRLLDNWKDRQLARERPAMRRAAFLDAVDAGERTFEVLNFPLFPYQREGMMHLAFKERALLADEMGLGKTCQALAACEILRQTEGVGRALVVCPASLKSEWAEQIESATNLPYRTVFGPRAARLEAYRNPEFFTIANYEQILIDGPDLQNLLQPDIVILDEAQRIKNWRTKTATAVKQLRSRFAFVLTGTPIENRIDEIYSILQFLDPTILGPLFRFNRQYYRLDDRGRAIGYKNLHELGERVKPYMLRRRKVEVEDDLPGRTVNNYFVPMTEEQQARYEDYALLVARIASIAHRRPLTEAEFKRLQLGLACMRMICDTPYILDEKVRDCPKLDELERILEELLGDADSKVIIFSEWVRMLSLVQSLLSDIGIDYALHTGSVPQKQRKAEISRFKEDPDCRVFLSSESGGTGLNLQVANAVVNLDQPWNPAKLEQRIARAWRKHQKRSVTVANLVSENSIEHNMLFLIEQKKAVAGAVLDGESESGTLNLPSGRAAFLQRLEEVMGTVVPKERTPKPEVEILDRFREAYGDRLVTLEMRESEDGLKSLLAVVDPDDDGNVSAYGDDASGIAVRTLDRETHEKMLQLEASGFLKLTSSTAEVLYQTSRPDPKQERAKTRLAEARALLESAERKFRMATLLAGGGFAEEAVAHAPGIAEDVIWSLSKACEDATGESKESAATVCERLAASGHLPEELLNKSMWLCIGDDRSDDDIEGYGSINGQDDLKSAGEILVYARGAVAEASAAHVPGQ